MRWTRWTVPYALAALALMLVPARPLAAQAVTVELRAGAAVGNYTETDAGLDNVPGPAYGAVVEVSALKDVAAYIGFTRSSFGCEEGWCQDQDVTLTSQGLVLGARWSPGWIWARAGLAFQGLDLEATGSDASFDPGPGVELGGGLAFDVGRGVELRPGITYLRHPAETDLGDGHVALLAFQLGIAAEVARF